MGRKLVWLATLVMAGSIVGAGVASAQYRGYGYDYGAAPGYYGGGAYGGDYDDPGYAPRLRRFQQQQSYDYDQRDPRGAQGAYQGQDPRDQDAYRPDPRAYQGPQRADRDPGYGAGYDQGPAPYYVDPRDGGRDPDHKASDLDLREGSQQATKTEVENPTKQAPGTIVIDTASRHLYLVEQNGMALQYGIGVGREGFAWKGVAHVQRKAEWPDWIPPSDMLKRRPDLPTRMEGGIENPLGARAMYLFQGNKDTMFRIHGTNEPDSIGKAMSSGCIRMMNNDVVDLYSRIPVGTKVVVL